MNYFRSFQNAKVTAATTMPTFEDLSIDVNLDEMQRFIKYIKSPIGLQR
jgi:hypothetical protein